MWTATKDGGLAANMYGPNQVSAPTTGGRVNITVETDYPFSEVVTMRLATEGGGATTFPLHLRLPGWCTSPKIQVNGITVAFLPNALGFHVEVRPWKTGDVVVITLPMEVRIETAKTVNVGGVDNSFNLNRNNEVVAGLPFSTVSLGPLLFALPLEAPNAEWRFALIRNQTLVPRRSAMPTHWDWPLMGPLAITAKARKISNFEDVWQLPMHPDVAEDDAAPVEVELVPYGCTQVFKVSMMPFV
jgi:hypothetical protein